MLKMQYEEPALGETFIFALIPVTKLTVGKYQREQSSTFVNKLLNSVTQGFITPLVVIEREDGMFEVIDGQHRLAALQKAFPGEDKKVPAIVVPEAFRQFPLFYNIERGDSLKDKLSKVWSLYVDAVQQNGEKTERFILPSVNYEPYLITLAFAFCERALKTPSLVESAVKKLDNNVLGVILDGGEFEPLVLKSALDERKAHADQVVQLERRVLEIAERYNVTDYNLKKAILSQAMQTLWGRKRKLDVDFYEGMEALFKELENSDWSWLAQGR